MQRRLLVSGVDDDRVGYARADTGGWFRDSLGCGQGTNEDVQGDYSCYILYVTSGAADFDLPLPSDYLSSPLQGRT
jgi:hypothetical protein